MNMEILTYLNPIALGFGFLGTIFLGVPWFSTPVGRIFVFKDGGREIRFPELHPMIPGEEKEKIVRSSHRRARCFTPLGWGLLALSFFFQLIDYFF